MQICTKYHWLLHCCNICSIRQFLFHKTSTLNSSTTQIMDQRYHQIFVYYRQILASMVNVCTYKLKINSECVSVEVYISSGSWKYFLKFICMIGLEILFSDKKFGFQNSRPIYHACALQFFSGNWKFKFFKFKLWSFQI